MEKKRRFLLPGMPFWALIVLAAVCIAAIVVLAAGPVGYLLWHNGGQVPTEAQALEAAENIPGVETGQAVVVDSLLENDSQVFLLQAEGAQYIVAFTRSSLGDVAYEPQGYVPVDELDAEQGYWTEGMPWNMLIQVQEAGWRLG